MKPVQLSGQTVQQTTSKPLSDSFNFESASSLDSQHRRKSIDSDKDIFSPQIIRNDKKSTFFQRIPPKTATLITYKNDRKSNVFTFNSQAKQQQQEFNPTNSNVDSSELLQFFRNTSNQQSFHQQNPQQFVDPLRRMTVFEHPPTHEILRALTPPTIPRRKSAEGRQFGFINQKISFCDQIAPFNPNYWFFLPKHIPPLVEIENITSPIHRKPKEMQKTRILTVLKQQQQGNGNSNNNYEASSNNNSTTAAEAARKRKSFATFKEEDQHALYTPYNYADATSTRKASRLTTIVPHEQSPASLSNTSKNTASNAYHSQMSFSQKITSLTKEQQQQQQHSQNPLQQSPPQQKQQQQQQQQQKRQQFQQQQQSHSSSSFQHAFEQSNEVHSSSQPNSNQTHRHFSSQPQSEQQFLSKPRTIKHGQHSQSQVNLHPATTTTTTTTQTPSQKEFFLKANFLKPKSSQQPLKETIESSPSKDSSVILVTNGGRLGMSRLKKIHTNSAKSITLPSTQSYSVLAGSGQNANQSNSTFSTQQYQQQQFVDFQQKAFSHRTTVALESSITASSGNGNVKLMISKHSKTTSKHSISEFIATDPYLPNKRSTVNAPKPSQYLFSQVYIANNPLYQKKKQSLSRTNIPTTPRKQTTKLTHQNIASSTASNEGSQQPLSSQPTSFGEIINHQQQTQSSGESSEIQQQQLQQQQPQQAQLHSQREVNSVKSTGTLPQLNIQKKSLNNIIIPTSKQQQKNNLTQSNPSNKTTTTNNNNNFNNGFAGNNFNSVPLIYKKKRKIASITQF